LYLELSSAITDESGHSRLRLFNSGLPDRLKFRSRSFDARSICFWIESQGRADVLSAAFETGHFATVRHAPMMLAEDLAYPDHNLVVLLDCL